jgi:hypothetical protein
MILPKRLLVGVSFAVCVMLPAPGFCDVKIVLKNGRSVAAESCEDRGGRLTCFREGGSFSIEKEDISEIKSTPPGKSAPADESFVEKPSEEGLSGEAGAEKKDGAQTAAGPEKELEKKLGEITRRKKELTEERARLLEERERLKADLGKSPDWMTEKQFAELSGRITDLDKRIKKFNEEVPRLDIEEQKIIDQLEGRSQKQGKQPEQD